MTLVHQLNSDEGITKQLQNNTCILFKDGGFRFFKHAWAIRSWRGWVGGVAKGALT